MTIGVSAMKLGAGRATMTDVIDMSAGILLRRKWGTKSLKATYSLPATPIRKEWAMSLRTSTTPSNFRRPKSKFNRSSTLISSNAGFGSRGLKSLGYHRC
jgi:hypothetical protein